MYVIRAVKNEYNHLKCTDEEIHHSNHDTGIFLTPKCSLVLLTTQSPFIAYFRQTLTSVAYAKVHINKIIQYFFFCVWLLSLSILLGFIYIITCVSSSFHNLLYKHNTICLTVYLLMEIHAVSKFWLLWIKIMWTFICKSNLWLCWFLFIFHLLLIFIFFFVLICFFSSSFLMRKCRSLIL